ncbi:hypothetical protein SLS55_009424 [Diplodia seriata]|uniref:DASH complex subunit SPC34 n=1 Tax=Diplodia seriata TaxID=420778 RepID=A0ABR3C2P5_9PEZI
MTLLDAHLEQISLCSTSIAELPFPRPKIFANALLHPHDITALIRDTESHERALFSVPPPQKNPTAQEPSSLAGSNRRATVFNAPRRNTAVAAILGNDLVERIREGGGGGAGSTLGYRSHIPGVDQKIVQLRQRHARLTSSLEHYELRVAEQQARLARMNKPRDEYGDEAEESMQPELEPEEAPLTMEDLMREEEEIRALENKKRGLEDRVNSMGKDIYGVQRALR